MLVIDSGKHTMYFFRFDIVILFLFCVYMIIGQKCSFLILRDLALPNVFSKAISPGMSSIAMQRLSPTRSQ